MRNAVQRSDGTLAISPIRKPNEDLARYLVFRAGKSILEIAEEEGVDADKVQKSIKRGRNIYEVEQQIRLRDAKYESAIESEQLRSRIRRHVATKLVDGMDLLLGGKRTIAEVNSATGEITFKEFIDPEVIAMGIEAARKTVLPEERQGPNTIVNVQQNTNVDNSVGTVALSYEERLERIHTAQGLRDALPPGTDDRAEIPMSRQIIEAAATVLDDPPASEGRATNEEPLF